MATTQTTAAAVNPPFFRSFEVDSATINDKDRTVEVCFSSEFAVDRGEYDEVLDHAEGSVDLARLNDGGAVLVGHNMSDQVGVVEKARVDADKRGRALIRFGNGQRATEIWQDIKDRIRRKLSVGYERLRVISNEVNESGRRCIRFAWSPYEVSVVGVGADPNAAVGRSKDQTRTYTNDNCSWLCWVALRATNKALTLLESHTGDKHAEAAEAARDVIAALAIAAEDISCWSEATAAECVSVCIECADYCDKAVASLRTVAGCAECADAVGNAIHELEEAAECCRKNAGVPVKDEAKAAEGAAEAKGDMTAETRAKVDTTPLPKADADAATNRNAKTERNMPENTPAPAAPTVNVEEVRNKALETERARVKNIRAAADKIAKDFPEGADKFRSLADAAVDAGKSTDDFNAELLAAMPGVRKATVVTAESLGMSQRDVNQYSLGRAIQSVVRKQMSSGGTTPDGLEGEVHKAMEQRMKSMPAGVSATGFWVPHDIGLASGTRTMSRDLNVTTAAQGGNFVQTSILTPIIEILRNRMVCKRLGVQSMAGLEGNIAIPRQTGTATAFSLAESASLTKSTQSIDQVLLSPKRVGAYNEYSKQLLLQSSVDVENFIRDDLMKVLAIKWDKLILEGSGAGSEPTGILHTDAIGSVTFGAAATWQKVLDFESSLATANADLGKMAYVTTPGVRGKWKATPKVGTTFPVFIWEKGEWADGSNDGEVNGYRAAATNQIANNAVAFGNWEDAIHALWGGYDVVVNPYARDIDAVVRITVNTFGDVAVRHAASFCWSSDAGNQ